MIIMIPRHSVLSEMSTVSAITLIVIPTCKNGIKF